jgi:hypothetical protein
MRALSANAVLNLAWLLMMLNNRSQAARLLLDDFPGTF